LKGFVLIFAFLIASLKIFHCRNSLANFITS